MKKRNLYLYLALGSFLLASCSNEEMPVPAPGGGDGTVTFTASIPSADLSRYGEGDVAKQLHYAVYETGTTEVVFASDVAGSPVPAAVDSRNFSLTLQLVKGKTYDFIFWADAASDSPYTFSSAGQSVSVDYTASVAANDENRDAFFQSVTGIAVSGPMRQSVELRRPFAQLNVGTSDLKAVEAAKAEIEKVDVTVTEVYATLNLLSGVASDAQTVTFSGALPTGQTFPVEGYDYLSMDYLLTGAIISDDNVQTAQRELKDATITATYKSGETATVEVPQMPVQRNYRTNIYGALLTSPLDLTITVVPDFYTPDVNLPQNEPWDGKTVESPVVDNDAKTVAIESPAQFIGFVNMVNGADGSAATTFAGFTVSISADVDFNGHEIPMIATGATRLASMASGKSFAGVLDGNGHTVKNFVISNTGSGSSATGFVASLKGAGAVLRDITFENVEIATATSEQTGLVGLLSNGARLENVVVKSGKISGTEATGALVGRILSSGTVVDCSNAADVVASKHNCGGIVGAAYYRNNGMLISNCSNSGTVTGATTAVGGVVGFNCGDIEGCQNSGAVKGQSAVGGIVGEQQNAGAVRGCHNTAPVVNTGGYGAGGVVGWLRYSGGAAYYKKEKVVVSACSNSAAISGVTGVAGIVGMIYTYGTVENCVNTAPSITASGTFASGLANQQTNDGSKFDDLAAEVIVRNNVSTTPADAITGACNAQYIYINDADAVTLEGNTDVLP